MTYFDTLSLNHSIDFNNLKSLPAKWKADDEKRNVTGTLLNRVAISEKKRYQKKMAKIELIGTKKDFDIFKIHADFPQIEFKVCYPPVIPLAIKEPDVWHCKFCNMICGGEKFESGYCNEDCYFFDVSKPKQDSVKFYYSDSLK